MFRFLHLADIHLDTAFAARTPELRSAMRAAIRTAFERAVSYAIDHQLDAVLIAGDLFDGSRLSFATERFLVEQLARLHEVGIRSVYATGNHDPGGIRSRVREIRWPESFAVVGAAKPKRFTMRSRSDDGTVVVVAAGHASTRESQNLAAAFPVADGPPHIGLLHAQVTTARGAEQHDRYAPCTTDDLEKVGYAYWALGHVHTAQRVSETCQAYYPGNLQGRNPRETGAKGGLVVSIAPDATVDVRFEEFASIQFRTIRLDELQDVRALEELRSRVNKRFLEETQAGPSGVDWILRLELDGSCPLANELRTEEQRSELSDILLDDLGVLDLEVRARTLTLPVDIDSFRNQTHVISEALDVLDEVAADPKRLAEILRTERPLTDDDPERLSELMHALDRELVARLLVDH